MIIKIDALDTLFFRDGKPFNMGEDTWANSVFPSSPSVIYGALRSAYFAEHIDKLGKANDKDDPTRNLKIKGVYFLIGGAVYFYLPLDCVKDKDNKDKPVKVSVLSVKKNESLSSCPTSYILFNKDNKKVENVPNGLVRLSMFEKYQTLQTPVKFSIQEIKDCVISEPKMGIGKGKETGTSEEGKLYRVDMKRLKNSGIVVDFESLDLPKKGMMKLGGKGKAVAYEPFEPINFSINNINFDSNSNGFKLYLSTPAIFKNGWLPSWINEKTLIGEYKGLELKLLTATIGKLIYIGGFDMKKRKPKPMYRAVPAGSVYYFEIEKGDIQKAFETFNRSAISDQYPEQGFGVAYIGKI